MSPMTDLLSTGDLARATGYTVRAIRFYEEQGLLKPSHVSTGGHRRYTEGDLERLGLILDLREIGLTLCEIRTLLDLRSGCSTAGEFAARFHDALRDHIGHTRRRIERLQRVKRELADALETVSQRLDSADRHQECPCLVAAGGGAPRIVKVLAQKGSCQHPPGEVDGPPDVSGLS